MAAGERPEVPKLRFPEFEEVWDIEFVGSLLDRQSDPVAVEPDEMYRQIGVRSHGRGIFHKEPVSGRELGGKRVFHVVPNAFVVNIVFAWEQAVALTTDAEAGFIASHRFPMFLEKEKKSFLPFIRELFLRKRGKQLLELASPGGAGRNKTLGQQDFLKLKVRVPKRDEQKKIAAFLGAVDEKLAALRKKRDLLTAYKRGAMQQIFSQKFRFSRDDGSAFPDWEEVELRELASRCTEKNVRVEHTRVLTNSAVQGIIDQADYFDKDIANIENLSGSTIVEYGDFVYNPRISVSAPVGPIKQNLKGVGVMSPLYSVFRFSTDSTAFYVHFFETSLWHEYLKSVANYGARHDRMAISTGDFMAMPLPLPHSDEQQKIADFLSALDAKIDAVAAQITHMEAFKKGLLQQMFV